MGYKYVLLSLAYSVIEGQGCQESLRSFSAMGFIVFLESGCWRRGQEGRLSPFQQEQVGFRIICCGSK